MGLVVQENNCHQLKLAVAEAMKLSRIIFFLLIISCSPSNKKVTVQLDFLEDNDNPENCIFQEEEIRVTFHNNSSDSIFIPNLNIGKIEFHDYIPILENYGSFKAHARVKLENLAEYKEQNKQGSVKDTFQITFPVFYGRFQKNVMDEQIDLFYEISRLKKLYRTQDFYCKENKYEVPEPPQTMLNSGINDTLWLVPNETRRITYDISPFMMRKATYEFQFSSGSHSTDSSYNRKKVDGYIQYYLPLRSEKIIITSYAENFPNAK